jgi:glycosyltransferase involved in cell wall biosynthesis
MRVTLIGPAFPWRGGLPLLVTDLAHRLGAAGAEVRLRTWSTQGPAHLLPAQRHPLTSPEAGVHPTLAEPLSWRDPIHWWRTGHRAGAESDVVVLVHYTTLQAPALWAIARRARRRATVILICANAVPHESRPGDRALLGLLARSVDAILVHTPAERAALAALTDRLVTVADLPPHLPAGAPRPVRPDAPPLRRLLFFGKIRHYKGLDVLLRALARTADVDLAVVGEIYEDESELRRLIAELGLTGRVRLRLGYLPARQIPELFAGVDALVLPYRTATASQHVALAHWHGLPVVATRVGNFPDMIDDGTDGLLCAPDDVADLAGALHALYQPGRLPALRAAVEPADADSAWRRYLTALLGLTGHPHHPATGRGERALP